MLDNNGATRHTVHRSVSKGFQERGKGAPNKEPVVVQIPAGQLEGAEQSVCGVKGFLVDETRIFVDDQGQSHEVSCAKVAALDIHDSPVHVHGETLETYHVISGSGRMVLNDEVVSLSAGSFVVLPPGVEHGLCSDTDEPLRVVMTFTPGLASVNDQAWRDERICYPAASARIKALE